MPCICQRCKTQYPTS